MKIKTIFLRWWTRASLHILRRAVIGILRATKTAPWVSSFIQFTSAQSNKLETRIVSCLPFRWPQQGRKPLIPTDQWLRRYIVWQQRRRECTLSSVDAICIYFGLTRSPCVVHMCVLCVIVCGLRLCSYNSDNSHVSLCALCM